MAANTTRRLTLRRRFGVRLWLSLAFAAVGIVTGISVYAFVSGRSEESAQQRSTEIAIGQTFRLAEQVEQASPGVADEVVSQARSESYAAWVYDRQGRLTTPATVLGSPPTTATWSPPGSGRTCG